MTFYIAYCGGYQVADPSPERARQRAISDMWCQCNGQIACGSWAWEQIEACKAREPREATAEEAQAIIERNWSAWATGVISG